MRALQYVPALLALATIAVWNAIVVRVHGSDVTPVTTEDPDLVEHERNWYDYLRGFHAHHGSVDGEKPPGDHPEHGSFFAGLRRWQASGYLRGYTLGNDVYLAPNAPRSLRVHQAGHAPAFGRTFDPIYEDRRDDGGLPDELLRSFDVMLPGGFPHTFLKFRDPRGLGDRYDDWLTSGRIRRR